MIPLADIKKALARLSKPVEAYSPAVLPADAEGAITLGELGCPVMIVWLDAVSSGVEGADSHLSAAYLAGNLGWAIADLFGGLALDGCWLSAVCAEAIALRPRAIDWEVDGESGTSQTFDIAIDFERISFSSNGDAFQTTLEEMMAHVVESIHAHAPLPRAALWRLIGDSVSAAMLAHGKALGREQEGMDLALSMLRAKGTRLYSKQTGFVHVALPERTEVGAWFRKRGGCCRYYTSAGGEYCATCVLRDDLSREQRLKDYLRRTHAA